MAVDLVAVAVDDVAGTYGDLGGYSCCCCWSVTGGLFDSFRYSHRQQRTFRMDYRILDFWGGRVSSLPRRQSAYVSSNHSQCFALVLGQIHGLRTDRPGVSNIPGDGMGLAGGSIEPNKLGLVMVKTDRGQCLWLFKTARSDWVACGHGEWMMSMAEARPSNPMSTGEQPKVP